MSEITDSQPNWYTRTTEDVGSELQVDPTKGLSTSEAELRLGKYGPNQLEEKKKEPGWQAFLRQYQDLMQFVLLGAAIINQIFTGEWGGTLVLVGLTIFNAVLGLRGEAKAEASLAALAGAMESIARVRRDGQAVEVDAGELVPGDIVLMEAGNRVPADGRLFVTATLECLSIVQETLMEVIPRYESGPIQKYVPIFIRREAVKRLQAMQAHFAAPEKEIHESEAGLIVEPVK